MDSRSDPRTVSRRQVMRLLAAIGVTGPAALGLAAQVERRISPEMLRDATAMLDQDFDDERLRIVTPALQSNLDQFEIIRDLEIDDLVEPATLFLARGKP